MDYNPQVLNTTLGGRSGYGKVGTKIYLLDHGGVGIDVFDLETNSSSNKQATSSNPTTSHGVASLNGLVYAIGGTISNVPTNRVRSYDPAANSYTELDTMNRAREHPFPVAFNNKIYVFGGISQSGRVDAVERYDTVANTWTEISQLPEPVRTNHEQICPVVVGQKLYVLIPHPSSKIGYLYHYNGEDTWVRKADFPHPEAGGGNREVIFSHGNKIFVVGKSTYDEATNQWLPTRYGSWNHGGSSFGSRVVCFVDGNKMISIGGGGAGIMSMDLSKIRYFFVTNGDSNGSFSGGGTPATGSITLDMLSPEVKARLTDANATASAPVGATLANPYGWGGTPIAITETEYTVPADKVLVIASSKDRIYISDDTFRQTQSGSSILPGGTTVRATGTQSAWTGMLHDPVVGVTPLAITETNYTVPQGKVLVISSTSYSIWIGSKVVGDSNSKHMIIPSGVTVGNGGGNNAWTGYLKDN
jgi:hypothetical protein